MKRKVCFIILHYGKNTDITMNVINSIKALENKECVDIVVVCNGREYNLNKNVAEDQLSGVDIVVLEDNKGFSVGNNAGYVYAKKKDDYDFIIFVNNDIVIEQKDFIERLYHIYERNPFYVGGPDIYIPYTAYHSSPMEDKLLSLEDISQIIVKRRKAIQEYQRSFSLKVFKSYILDTFNGRNTFSCFFKVWRRIRKNNKKYEFEQQNVILQGACLIFSRDYISCNQKAFEPEVFLYFEEYYLARKCERNQWKTLYSNEIQVIHLHRGSSGLFGQTYREYCKKRI